MEEDIKEIIKVFKCLEFETYEWDVYYDGKLQINCDTMTTYLKKLLNELERLQKENSNISRELIHRTDELNKLLEENKVLKEHFDISDHECFRLEQKEIKLEKEIEQLKKENEELKCKYAKDGRVLFTIEAINERYIPKIRIRDKIEELEKELKEYDLEEYCLYEDTIQERIKIYKELLGDE